MRLTKDDFEEWKDGPVTQEIIRRLRIAAEASRAEWIERAWGGDLSQEALLSARMQCKAYSELANLTWEQVRDDDDSSEG